jgi:NAD(P)-dependent dehydrogenase (short-subunit alcohol dehydrogenase family)
MPDALSVGSVHARTEKSWGLENVWQESIDIMLTGAWGVCKGVRPQDCRRRQRRLRDPHRLAQLSHPSARRDRVLRRKAGVIMMMKMLAKELGPQNILINAINPGGIATPVLLDGATVGNHRAGVRTPPRSTRAKGRRWQWPRVQAVRAGSAIRLLPMYSG